MNRLFCKIVFGLALVLSLAVGPNKITTSAAQMNVTDAALPYVAGYEVTNETITPGGEFVLTMQIKNYSSRFTAEDVVVTVSNPEGVVPEYGTVNVAYIDKIPSDSSKEVSFKYSANSDIKVTELNFTVDVISDTSSSSAQLRIPVGRMTDFEVEEYAIPEKLEVGKVGYASALVENVGNSGVSNVVMVARCEGKDIASANIGTISAGTTKTQYVGLVFEEEGKHAVEFLLTYVNSEGVNKEFVICSDIVSVTSAVKEVTETEVKNDSNVNSEKQENANEKIGTGSIVVISVSGVLLIALCCVILLLLYRRK